MATFVKRKPAKLVVVDPPLPIQKVVFDESSVLFTSLTSFVPELICMVMVWLPLGGLVGGGVVGAGVVGGGVVGGGVVGGGVVGGGVVGGGVVGGGVVGVP